MLNWSETEKIMQEILHWMRKNTLINENTYNERIKKIRKIMDEIIKINEKEIKEFNNEFTIKRFINLDDAQKAFVLLAIIDERLNSEHIKYLKINNFKILVNTIYLNLVKAFSNIRNSLNNNLLEKEDYISILNYLKEHPHIKKLGCGQFSLNFYKHIKNVLKYLYNID
ncbi:MAG: hypothetical protein ACTSWR_07195 [Candidatus Helarchaeota archaeon]